MTALLSIAGRFLSAKVGFWLPVALGLALCLSYGLLRAEKRHSAKVETRLQQEVAASALFAAKVKATSEEITRKATEAARHTETVWAAQGQEIDREYQNNLAALRAHYDGLRNKASGANPGSSRPGMPVVPGSAPVADAATTSCPLNMFNAEANKLQLGALQDWIKSVSEVR